MAHKKEIDTEITLNLVLHILRNPADWSEEAIRTIRLWAADRLEKMKRLLE